MYQDVGEYDEHWDVVAVCSSREIAREKACALVAEQFMKSGADTACEIKGWHVDGGNIDTEVFTVEHAGKVRPDVQTKINSRNAHTVTTKIRTEMSACGMMQLVEYGAQQIEHGGIPP